MVKKRPSKPVPPIYPEPAPINIETPLKIASIDIVNRVVTFEGPTPPELVKLIETERWRIDLQTRLGEYTANCLGVCLKWLSWIPDWKKQSVDLPADAKGESLLDRVRNSTPNDLKPEAPPEARDALLALPYIQKITDGLASIGDYPDIFTHVVCWAIDLGQLLQRQQDQFVHGANVARGQQTFKALTESKQKKSASKRDLARQELQRRMSQGGSKTSSLRAMSNVMVKVMDKLKKKWGSYRTLVGYCRDIPATQPKRK